MSEFEPARDYVRRGPWDEKVRDYVRQLYIIALVHKLDNDIIEYEFKLDYGNAEDRKFLGRLSFWCIVNKRSVETMNIEDWEKMR